MTDAQLADWERLIANASADDLRRYLPTISEMAAPVHPESGRYSYLLGLVASRLVELDQELYPGLLSKGFGEATAHCWQTPASRENALVAYLEATEATRK